MRNLIDIVETNIVPYDHDQAFQGDIAGPPRENMNVQEAREYLDMYPDGVLSHDMFDTDSFVAVTKYGSYVFYNAYKDRLEFWDWNSDIAELYSYFERDQDYNPMVGWWYNSGEEQLGYSEGGIEFWDRIRNGLEIPVETGS